MCAMVGGNSLQGLQFGGFHLEGLYVVFQSGMGAKRGGVVTLWPKGRGLSIIVGKL